MSDRFRIDRLPINHGRFALLDLLGPMDEVLHHVTEHVPDKGFLVSGGVDDDPKDPMAHVIAVDGTFDVRDLKEIPMDAVDARLRSGFDYLHLVQALGAGQFVFNGEDTLEINDVTSRFVAGLGTAIFSNDTLMQSRQNTDTSLFIGRPNNRVTGVVSIDRPDARFLPASSGSVRVATAGPLLVEAPYGGTKVRYVQNRDLVAMFEDGPIPTPQDAFTLPGTIADLSIGIAAAERFVLLVTYHRGTHTFVVPVLVGFGKKRPVFTVQMQHAVKVTTTTAIVKYDRGRITSVNRTGDGPAISFAGLPTVTPQLREMLGAYATA